MPSAGTANPNIHVAAAFSFEERNEKFKEAFYMSNKRERRSYVNVGLGCTGGRHRSVAIADRLQGSFSTLGYQVTVAHRDIKR